MRRTRLRDGSHSPSDRGPARWSFRVLLALMVLGCRREAAERTRASESAPTGATVARGAAADRFPNPERPVSSIVSPRWSNEDARDDAGEADTVLALLGVRAGSRVADIGAGSGYYTVRAARRVAPNGVVFAEDITPRYVDDLRERVRKDSLGQVTVVLGAPHDPRLPPGSVDVALLVHMYHEIEQPYALLFNLAPALRAGGRVAILDLDRPTGAHGTPPSLLRCELDRAGYSQAAFHTLAPGEYLAVFTPPPAGSVTPEAISAAVRRAPCSARR